MTSGVVLHKLLQKIMLLILGFNTICWIRNKKIRGFSLPTVTIKKQNLFTLLGKKIRDSELRKKINLVKPEVEEITSQEIKYSLNPDRPDLFSSSGLARALKGFLAIETGLRVYEVEKGTLSVKAKEVNTRPYIGCAIVKELELNESIVEELMEFQEALHTTIGRNRRKMAIGLHDLEFISPPIQYLPSPPEKKMTPLQVSEQMTLREILAQHPKGRKFGKLLQSNKEYPTIIDTEGVFSFPPIINSNRTQITQDTSDIFIDITGTSLSVIRNTMSILVTSLADRNGKIEKINVNYPPITRSFPNLEVQNEIINEENANKLVGMELSSKKIVDLLEKMRYGVEIVENDRIKVLIPPYRSDILHPVDIMEDICIAYGFNEIALEPAETSTIGSAHPIESFTNKVREIVIGLGFQEVMNPTLVNESTLTKKMQQENTNAVEIANPVSEEYKICRNRLLPSLLEFLSKNIHLPFPQKVFEIEDVIVTDRTHDTKTKNVKKIAAVISDHKVGYSDIRAHLDAILQNFCENHVVKPVKNPSFITGRVGKIIIKEKDSKKKLGILGEFHPKVLVNFGLEKPVAGLELNLGDFALFTRD